MLSGADAGGREFCEDTRTLVLSLHGASVLCHHKLIPEQELYLSAVSPAREIEVRVCGQIGKREDGYIYGVAFAKPEADFWRMDFSRGGDVAQHLIPETLECTGCHRQASLLFDATEMDVYMVNEGTLRYCVQCGVATIWKLGTPKAVSAGETAASIGENRGNGDQAEQARRVSEGAERQRDPALRAPEAELKGDPGAMSAPLQPVERTQTNRRRERRTQVKCNACIRVLGWAEEIVPCEDMSRGGFSFRSEREYSVETMMEAAVPYTAGGMSIFVPAQIANMRELAGGKVFRYGVAYIRAGKR